MLKKVLLMAAVALLGLPVWLMPSWGAVKFRWGTVSLP